MSNCNVNEAVSLFYKHACRRIWDRLLDSRFSPSEESKVCGHSRRFGGFNMRGQTRVAMMIRVKNTKSQLDFDASNSEIILYLVVKGDSIVKCFLGQNLNSPLPSSE
uniref:Uncharacterized protein n=1 Tax=Cacopsylla melanoneura TaxID=428564 RepID=A0A8D8ZEW2_9HEMI